VKVHIQCILAFVIATLTKKKQFGPQPFKLNHNLCARVIIVPCTESAFFLCESDGIMELGATVQLNSRDEWRAWLAEHHQEVQEIWLVLHNSSSGKRELTMSQAQEEALCFGWVDSTLKPIDEASYALRFSPRHRLSRWGRSNRARALKMLRSGKMTPAGMALLPPEVLRMWEKENARSTPTDPPSAGHLPPRGEAGRGS
jgi:hypothetical protein